MSDQLRRKLGDLLDVNVDHKGLQELTDAALNITERTRVYVTGHCVACGKWNNFKAEHEFPDHLKRAKALEILVNLSSPKPAETVNVNQTLHITLEELAALPEPERQEQLAKLSPGQLATLLGDR